MNAATPPTDATIDMVDHKRIRLALHRLVDVEGPPLLLLHGLGERTPDTTPTWIAERWPGPIFGLDFTGHGRSTVPSGGGYSCEVLMGDADIALQHIGGATVLGRGIGGYVAVLLAGARPDAVQGAIITDGPGLAGGDGPGPGAAIWTLAAPPGPPDPYALMELGTSIRPADYAVLFARHAVEQSALDLPISVSARLRPAWLQAVAAEHGVVTEPAINALSRYHQDNQ